MAKLSGEAARVWPECNPSVASRPAPRALQNRDRTLIYGQSYYVKRLPWMQLRSTAIGCGRFSVQGLSSRPWRWSRWVVHLLAAGCGNACLITGATVLDLPRRARQSTKGSTRQSLVEQTLTTGDFVARQPTRYTPSPFVVHALTCLFFAD